MSGRKSDETAYTYTPPRPISVNDQLDCFDCGKPALDDYLKVKAIDNEGRNARTYVVGATATGSSESRVVAYYSLASGSVARADMPRRIRHGLPNPTPVMVLARLAVDKHHPGRGLGTGLLRDALLKTAQVSKIAGVRALLVHAIDDEALNFYVNRDIGFQLFPSGGRILLLPIETLLAAL